MTKVLVCVRSTIPAVPRTDIFADSPLHLSIISIDYCVMCNPLAWTRPCSLRIPYLRLSLSLQPFSGPFVVPPTPPPFPVLFMHL